MRKSGQLALVASWLVAAGLFASGLLASLGAASEVVVIGKRASGPDRGLPAGASPGTISLWFARPAGVSDEVLFAYGAAEVGRARGLWLSGEDRVCFYFWGSPDDLHARAPSGIAPNRWHHLAGTYDGAVARLYLDGRLLGSVATRLDTRAGGRFFVGRNLVPDGRGLFPGLIEEARVYPRALSAREIGEIAAAGAARADRRAPVRFEEPDLDPGVEEIVFAVRQADPDGHWYANFGTSVIDSNRTYYHEGGRLCRLKLATGEVTTLLEDPAGGVRDPQVHYDGKKILFSYRRGGEPHYHLFEIGIDGSGLRQLTRGPYDDFEPTYLPGRDIIFCSSRCNRWVPCYFTQVAVLHRMDADGRSIRQLSANTEQENTPWPLPDGRILYQRWEYVDRSQIGYHHLWTMNPDGTRQMVYFGNEAPNTVMIDAKPIPGTSKVVASFSPGHGRTEHAGVITIVDPRAGPDERGRARAISTGGLYRDPYPLSEHLFLAAAGTRLYLLDDRGHRREIFDLPSAWKKGRMQVHEPRPLRARAREAAIAPGVDRSLATGRVLLQDVYEGGNMKGVARGEIEKLLVLEILPKPFNIFSGMEPLTYGGSFLLERIVGTVPVEPDGSAYLEVPALRPLFFVALDRDGMAVKRMQSFFTVQPGEQLGCAGCHEPRTRSPRASPASIRAALRRPPTPIEPIEGVPDVIDFPRDVQPILDEHCVACHDDEATERGGPRAGGIVLTGDRGPMYSHAYFTLTVAAEFADGRNLRKSNYPPRAIGSAASPLLGKLDGSHHGAGPLTEREKRILRLWIDTGAAYPGTYAAMGTGSIGDYATGRLDRSDLEWPSVKAARAVLKSRCASCHRGPTALPESPSDNRGLVPWGEGRMNALASRRSQIHNPAFRYSRHLLYNLTRPELSLLLLAPLARSAGGYGTCKAEGGGPARVFESRDDPGYRALLAAIRDAEAHLERNPRFDMPGFRPSEAYLREMRRYGILAAGSGDGGGSGSGSGDGSRDGSGNGGGDGAGGGSALRTDPYATDRAYWESTWRRALRGWQPGDGASRS